MAKVEAALEACVTCEPFDCKANGGQVDSVWLAASLVRCTHPRACNV